MLWNEGPLGPLETVFFNSMTLIFSSIFGNGRGTKGSHLSLTTDDRGMHSDYALHTLCQIKSILEADKRNHFMQKWPHGNGFFGTKRTGMHHWGVVLWLVSTRQNHSKVVALWAADQDRRRLNQNHLPNIRTDGKGAICFRRTQKCVSNESTRQITARQLRQPQKKRQKNYRTRKAEKTQIPTELIMPLIRKKRFLCQNSSIFPK